MNCATFEIRLTALLEGPTAGPERERLLQDCRKHVASCRACAGSGDLLELLGRPPGDRDLVPDPGPAYWDAFDARVRQRIGAEVCGGPRRRWVPMLAAAAAAVVLLGAAAVWLVRDSRPGPVRSVADSAASAALEDELAELPPEEASARLDALVGWSGAAEGDAGDLLFPDVSDLDADAGQELLDWLRRQSS